MAGLTPEGYVKLTLDEIKTQMENSFRAAFGEAINVEPGSVFGTIIGILAEREAEIWELSEAVYNASFVDTSTGVNLDNVVGYTGIERLPAEFSTIEDVILFGDSGTIIPAATQFSVEGNPNSVFESDFEVTLGAGVDEVQTVSFSATPDAGTFTLSYRGQVTSAIAFNATATAVQNALNALGLLSGITVTGSFAADFVVTFAGDDGKQNQPLLIAVSSLTAVAVAVDITVGETVTGEPQAIVNVTATQTGPIAAPYGTLIVIDTPVSGLDRVFNQNEELTGRNQETDAELRIRRAISLTASGNATVESIRARILNIDGVTNANIFENTDIVEVDGLPPKSFRALVEGGQNQDIGDVIWLAKPAGIETDGAISVNVIDSQGETRVVKFSRPTAVPIYVSIDLDVDITFPDNGAALAQAAIIAWGNSLGIGQDVIVFPRLVAQLNSIPGILDMVIRIDDAPVSTTPGAPAVDGNVIIAIDSVATFSEANTDINVII